MPQVGGAPAGEPSLGDALRRQLERFQLRGRRGHGADAAAFHGGRLLGSVRADVSGRPRRRRGVVPAVSSELLLNHQPPRLMRPPCVRLVFTSRIHLAFTSCSSCVNLLHSTRAHLVGPRVIRLRVGLLHRDFVIFLAGLLLLLLAFDV